MDPREIARLSDEACARAERENKQPLVLGSWRAESWDKAFDALRRMPNIGTYRPVSWELVEHGELALPIGWTVAKLDNLWADAPLLMVDKGFGGPDSRALMYEELVRLATVNPSVGWAIVEEGQFQVVVGAFRKVNPKLRDQSEDRVPRKDIQGVADAFVAGKRAKCHNADTDGQWYRLHASVIVYKTGPGKYTFNWSGWHTPTTAAHMNAVLKAMGSGIRVRYGQKVRGDEVFDVQVSN
jgi:hypothetical protein